ncbi:hypothetical protein Sjap_024392 [Stephania japonica]|uniref:Uncharacterized protein n=1 Tax=Stephania japonica TaxID=461633 RepID=A0AAP0HQ34_9MAGN
MANRMLSKEYSSCRTHVDQIVAFLKRVRIPIDDGVRRSLAIISVLLTPKPASTYVASDVDGKLIDHAIHKAITRAIAFSHIRSSPSRLMLSEEISKKGDRSLNESLPNETRYITHSKLDQIMNGLVVWLFRGLILTASLRLDAVADSVCWTGGPRRSSPWLITICLLNNWEWSMSATFSSDIARGCDAYWISWLGVWAGFGSGRGVVYFVEWGSFEGMLGSSLNRRDCFKEINDSRMVLDSAKLTSLVYNGQFYPNCLSPGFLVTRGFIHVLRGRGLFPTTSMVIAVITAWTNETKRMDCAFTV